MAHTSHSTSISGSRQLLFPKAFRHYVRKGRSSDLFRTQVGLPIRQKRDSDHFSDQSAVFETHSYGYSSGFPPDSLLIRALASNSFCDCKVTKIFVKKQINFSAFFFIPVNKQLYLFVCIELGVDKVLIKLICHPTQCQSVAPLPHQVKAMLQWSIADSEAEKRTPAVRMPQGIQEKSPLCASFINVCIFCISSKSHSSRELVMLIPLLPHLSSPEFDLGGFYKFVFDLLNG